MKKVLFIYQNAYSQTGGIQTFNEYFISALEDIKKEQSNFYAELLSIYDDDKDIKSSLKYTSLNKSKIASFNFVLKNYKKFDTFIFAHVNLAPLAMFLKLLNPKAKIYFCTHGIEIWKKLSKTTEWIMNQSTILTVSNFSKDQLLKYNQNLNDIRLFPNCIKVKEKIELLDNPYNTDNFNVLSVTRLSEGEKLKGIDSMIRTLPLLKEKIPNIKYSVIGKGEDTIRLKQLAKDLNVLEYVDFLGFVDDINAYYQHCDIFSLPSKKEGFGIVYLEAMQYRKPIIAVNYGGATDVVINNETGFLCEYNDYESLAENMLILFKDTSLYDKYANNGYDRLINNFTYEKYVSRLKNIFNV